VAERTVVEPRLEAVLFDYGGVLRREEGADFDAFAARFGLPPGRLWSAFHDIPEYRASRTGRIDDASYRAAVRRQLAEWIGEEEAARCLAEWDVLRAEDSPIVPEMRELIGVLRGRVKVGLLSNAGRGARSRLEAAGLGDLFDDLLCSGEVGLAKPDPAVYFLAANRLGVRPNACLFVDDMPHNVDGARQVGMRAFHYARSRHAELLRHLADLGLPVPPRRGQAS
jgi:putative hydrolase of the HAD superfamily